jgi:hypothetical protein
MNLKTKSTRKIKTCFVSAPTGISLDTLRESLLAHGIRPLIPQDLSTGMDWVAGIKQQLQDADLVVGVLPSDKSSSWVLFELGQASALNKMILLIASEGSNLIDHIVQRLLVLRTTPDNREAIDFALDQLLSSPPETTEATTKATYQARVLGAESDQLLNRLSTLVKAGDARSFESLVAEAIRHSGTDVVVESPVRDRGADLAVWSDVLQPFVGNPFLIEIKLRIKDRASAEVTFGQLNSFLSAASTSWGLLVYGEGPVPEDTLWQNCPPNILLLPAGALFESLRSRAFPEVIRDLRNRRVHSVRP